MGRFDADLAGQDQLLDLRDCHGFLLCRCPRAQLRFREQLVNIIVIEEDVITHASLSPCRPAILLPSGLGSLVVLSLSGRVVPGRRCVLGGPGLRCPDVVSFVLWRDLFYVGISGLLLVWRRGACLLRGLLLEDAIGDLLWEMVFASVNDYAPAKLVSQYVDRFVHVLEVPLNSGRRLVGNALGSGNAVVVIS